MKSEGRKNATQTIISLMLMIMNSVIIVVLNRDPEFFINHPNLVWVLVLTQLMVWRFLREIYVLEKNKNTSDATEAVLLVMFVVVLVVSAVISVLYDFGAFYKLSWHRYDVSYTASQFAASGQFIWGTGAAIFFTIALHNALGEEDNSLVNWLLHRGAIVSRRPQRQTREKRSDHEKWVAFKNRWSPRRQPQLAAATASASAPTTHQPKKAVPASVKSATAEKAPAPPPEKPADEVALVDEPKTDWSNATPEELGEAAKLEITAAAEVINRIHNMPEGKETFRAALSAVGAPNDLLDQVLEKGHVNSMMEICRNIKWRAAMIQVLNGTWQPPEHKPEKAPEPVQPAKAAEPKPEPEKKAENKPARKSKPRKSQPVPASQTTRGLIAKAKASDKGAIQFIEFLREKIDETHLSEMLTGGGLDPCSVKALATSDPARAVNTIQWLIKEKPELAEKLLAEAEAKQ